jgi:hypothetical protein
MTMTTNLKSIHSMPVFLSQGFRPFFLAMGLWSAVALAVWIALTATFAWKTGLCVRRARLVMCAPDPQHPRRAQAENPLIALFRFSQPPLCNPPVRR